MPRCEQCSRDFATEEALMQHNADKHRTGLTRHEAKQMKKQEKDEQRKHEQDKISRKRKIKTMTIIAVVLLGITGLAAFVVYLPKKETSSGNLQIGPVGSTHQHADFEVYINGQDLDFTSPQYQVRAREVHVEGGDDDVIHKHATGVTVGHFFRTLGFKVNSTCIKTDKGGDYCSNEDATLKYFLKTPGTDWENAEDLPDRDITDLDKYLITYGNETDLSTQQASVTDKAKIESGRLGEMRP